MQQATLDRLGAGIDAAKRYLRVSAATREALYSGSIGLDALGGEYSGAVADSTLPNRVQWRVLDHCATVTRIYALFEDFVGGVISDYVSYLETSFAFSELPEKVKDNYRFGVSKLLVSLHLPRYSSISLSDTIEQYGLALSGKAYRFSAEAFRLQEQNLRLSELSRLMSGVGVDEIQVWLQRHPKIKEFVGQPVSATREAVEARLQELVQYRNDASHSGLEVDDILSIDELTSLADFVMVLCIAIRECALSKYVDRAIENRTGRVVGIAKEVFKDGAVCVIRMTGNMNVGQEVIIKGDNFCTPTTVLNLQVEGADVQACDFAEPAEVGVMLGTSVKRNAKIIAIG